MKLSIFTFFTILMTAFGFCDTDSTHVKTKVHAVTVYPEGAQITREIKLTHRIGKSILIFDDLPYDISQDNLQLACNKLKHIQSLKLEKVYGTSKQRPKAILDLEQRIEDIKLEGKRLKTKLELLKQEQKLLSNNNKLNSTSNTIPLAELKQTVEYFNRKMESIENKKLDIALKKEELKDEVKAINKKLQGLYNVRKKNTSRLIVTIDNKTSKPTDYTLSYYHAYAGWEPSYDFRVEQIDKPLTADYNATVFQSTGEDWKDIKLTLATIEPILNEQIKELEPWVLEQRNASHEVAVPTPKPVPTHTITYSPTGSGTSLRGTITDDATGETIPMANVVVKSGQTIIQGGATDFDGNYVISPLGPGTYNIEISYIGYATQNITGVIISPSKSTQLNVELEEEGEILGEIQLSYEAPIIDPDKTGTVYTREHFQNGRDGYYSGTRTPRTPKKTQAPKVNINSIVDNILKDLKQDISYPEFTLDAPFTILADHKQTHVRI